MSIDSSSFSEREKEVLQLLLQGKSNKQIALALGISTRTVEFHLSSIYAKSGVNTRSEAIVKLRQDGLRVSTGGIPVETTADKALDSTENGVNPVLRRIDLKKVLMIIGWLAAFVLIAVLVSHWLSAQMPAAVPSVPAATSAVPVSLPAASAQPPTPTLTTAPPGTPARAAIPAHTVNGYTAAIESYYLDSSHLIFLLRLTGGDKTFGSEHFYDRLSAVGLTDANGNLINSSTQIGPAVDPALFEFEFVPVTLLVGDHLKGQFAFDLTDAPDYQKTLAQFRFDFDLPVEPDVRFTPKQSASADNLALLLDSLTVTAGFTQIYVCFPPLTNAPWTIGNQTSLQIDGQTAQPIFVRELFNSETGGDRRAGSEPYWAPPIKNGRCIKAGFPIGSSSPTSLTLSIPQLEKIDPEVLVKNQLLQDYPGLDAKQAYYKYLEEHGAVYKGPWTFRVELKK